MKRLILLLFLLPVLTTHAQQINTVKLDSLFTSLAKNEEAMGSIAIAKNGKVVYQKAMGYAVTESNTVANENTEYHIGSITKMFTAVLVFQLIEENKLSLNDTLSMFFPQLPNAGRITIGNLLYHRSGLPNFTNDTNFPDWTDKPKTHDELLGYIIGRKPDFEPNAKADYNNSNYLVLSYIIEKVCKKTYKEVLKQNITDRLKLTKTYYGVDALLHPNESASYTYFDNKWKKEKAADLNNYCGAGAIVSTPADLATFIDALFNYKLVKKQSLDKMKTLVDGYGMGLFPFESGTRKGYGHNGKTEGFASSLTYYPDEKLAVAYCTNGEVYPKADILNGVLSICFNTPYVIPTFKSLKLSAAELDRYCGTYLSKQPPIEVICTRKNSVLTLQTKGQIFTVEPVEKDRFMNKQFGFFFDFDLSKKQMVIEQGSVNYYLDLNK